VQSFVLFKAVTVPEQKTRSITSVKISKFMIFNEIEKETVAIPGPPRTTHLQYLGGDPTGTQRF
jgi:hypothetical protein